MSGELEKMIFGEKPDKLGATERRILKRHRERKTVSTDTNAEFVAKLGFGDRLSDSIARVGGSWGFIIGFLVFLVAWAGANTLLLTQDKFDPYPFIFLNLLLSMIAAIQAPVIMMSQNRQSERDRFNAAKDYEVNLKAEIEVLGLHQKIDTQVLKELKELREQVGLLMEEIKAVREK